MNPELDEAFRDATLWRVEAEKLREVLLGCGLTEEKKWGKPCYCHEGRNIAIIQRMKGFLALMFFRGEMLEDPGGVLRRQGENSESARRIEITHVSQLTKLKRTIQELVRQAILVNDTGVKAPKRAPLVYVDELAQRLAADRRLKAAFETLTPGRRREYNLYFSSAKQATTRAARVDKCVPKILSGKGFRE